MPLIDYSDAVVAVVTDAVRVVTSLTVNFVREDVGGNCTAYVADLPDGRTIVFSNGEGCAEWIAPTMPPRLSVAIYPPMAWNHGPEHGEPVTYGVVDNALDFRDAEHAVDFASNAHA